jgi:hypothetical protein
MAQVIGGICPQFNPAFSLEEAPTFGGGSSRRPSHMPTTLFSALHEVIICDSKALIAIEYQYT